MSGSEKPFIFLHVSGITFLFVILFISKTFLNCFLYPLAIAHLIAALCYWLQTADTVVIQIFRQLSQKLILLKPNSWHFLLHNLLNSRLIQNQLLTNPKQINTLKLQTFKTMRMIKKQTDAIERYRNKSKLYITYVYSMQFSTANRDFHDIYFPTWNGEFIKLSISV